MSDPVVQPAAKKGMSTGAKVAIGCLIAVVLGIGGCVIVSTYLLKKGVDKVKNFAEKAESDPDYGVYQAALWAFQMNPELEVVSSDEATKSITVRDKKSGKEVTFNIEDIKAGRLSIEADGETVNFDVDQSGENSGTMTVESGEGKMVFGAGDSSSLPTWIPSYPGARSDSYSTIEANGERSGTFTIHSPDSADQVLSYFEDRLKADGFEVQKTTIDANGAKGGNLTGTLDKRTVNVTVATQEGETQGLVAYNEKP